MTDATVAVRRGLPAEVGLAAMVLIWGLNFAVVKWAIGVVDPFGFNALRHLLASAFMLGALLIGEGIGRPARSDIARIVFLGVVGNIVYQVAFIIGIERTRAGNASLMLSLVPLFLLMMGSHGAGRRSAPWVGVGLSVLGVALVSGSALRLEGTATLVGDAILVVAAAVWAVYTVGAKPLIERYGPIRTAAWTLWVGSVGLVALGVPSLLRQDWSGVGAAAWVGIAYSSFLSIGLAYLLWYRGVERIGGARTAVFSNLTPVVALLAGAILLGEALTIFSMAGAAMVIGGILLVRADS